jgi:hypothetical protein
VSGREIARLSGLDLRTVQKAVQKLADLHLLAADDNWPLEPTEENLKWWRDKVISRDSRTLVSYFMPNVFEELDRIAIQYDWKAVMNTIETKARKASYALPTVADLLSKKASSEDLHQMGELASESWRPSGSGPGHDQSPRQFWSVPQNGRG